MTQPEPRATQVVVSSYSPEWPELFCALHDELRAVFAPTTVVIEHIGSTSVPGLAAKPVIDVLLGADSLAAIEATIPALAERGYEYVSKYETELPQRRYLVKASPSTLRVHVHGVETGSPIWVDHLAFRDALRADATLRDQYQALKLRLAQEFAQDKAAYTEAKAPFIRAVLATVTGPGASKNVSTGSGSS